MKLKCRINEQEYTIVTGATFSEEYSETLDSGSIVLDHIPYIDDLKPYDDVFIWDCEEEGFEDFPGYYNIGDTYYLAEISDNLISVDLTLSDTSNPYIDTQLYYEIGYENGQSILSGQFFDIWSYLFCDVKENYSERFNFANKNTYLNINLILIKSDYSTSSCIANYRLPTDPNDLEFDHDNLGTIKLVKTILSTPGWNEEYAPDVMWIPFIRQQGGANDEAEKGTFSLDGFNVSIDPYTTDTSPAVTFIGVKSARVMLLYGDDTIGIKNNITDNFTFIFDDLTLKQIVKMREIQFSGVQYGQICILDRSYFEKQDDTHIIMHFGVYAFYRRDAINGVDMHFIPDMILTKQNDDSWVGTFSSTTECFDSFDIFNYDEIFVQSLEKSARPSFYKHLLVDRYDAEMLDLDQENYKYKISLMSETKRLEKIILPNINITQPIVGTKRTALYYMQQYLNLYSPKIKKISHGNNWVYVNKYMLDQREPDEIDPNDEFTGIPLSAIFTDEIIAPEMSLTAPSLRDVLSRIMIVKDCIPVVKDDVIYAMRISDTHGTFAIDKDHLSFITETMDSSNYSTAFRREYEGAVTQKNTAHRIEYLGFRNAGDALLNISNMYIETQMPIYKINKLYLCYYKAFPMTNDEGATYMKLILVKQDISDLVLENTVRNTMSADWTKYPTEITTAEDMKKYKILTLGYDVGGTTITGWGVKYSYLGDALGWTSKDKTYLETIMDLLDGPIDINRPAGFFPFGIYQRQLFSPNEILDPADRYSWRQYAVSPAIKEQEKKNLWVRTYEGLQIFNPISDPYTTEVNVASIFKTMFFEMDYIGMYNGSLIHTKDNTDYDDIMTSDNSSSSLSIVEIDGLFEKEKINRLANPELSFIGRYDNYNQMNNVLNNKIGTVFGTGNIVHHREYQIYEDFILANFRATYDYVMRNYFTTVFAKYRTYSYASYNQSIFRKENDKYSIVLSADKCYYEDISNTIPSAVNILSAFETTAINSDLTVSAENQINGAYFTYSNNNTHASYMADCNSFVSGYSMCFNTKMFDTLTGGIYISETNCYDSDNNYVGSAQQWYKLPVNSNSDAFLPELGCYFGHWDNTKDLPLVNNSWTGSSDEIESLFDPILQLPLKQFEPTLKFGKEYNICKDDKEIIDYTLQYEIVNYEDSVLMSEWLMKLNYYNNYLKLNQDTRIIDVFEGAPIRVYYSTIGTSDGTYQSIVLRIPNGLINYLNATYYLSNATNTRPYEGYTAGDGSTLYYDSYFRLISMHFIVGDPWTLKVNAEITMRGRQRDDLGNIKALETTSKYITLDFLRMSNVGATGFTDFWYSGQDLEDLVRLPSWYDDRWDWIPGWIKNYSYLPVSGLNGVTPHNINWDNTQLNNTNSELIYTQTADQDLAVKGYMFHKNMYIMVSNEELQENIEYDTFPYNSIPSKYALLDSVDPLTVFSLEQDEYGRNFIHFSKSQDFRQHLPVGYTRYKSVHYWYYDDPDNKGDGYMHFVFGLNIDSTVEDKNVYVSLVTNRNPKVYNSLHRVVGTVTNCADPEHASEYGQQTFTETEGD